MRKLHLLALGILLLTTPGIYGQGRQQDSLRNDTLTKDSTHVAESLLLQHREEALIDSVVRRQLQTELRQAIGNVTKTKELQEQLQAITLRDSLRIADQLKRINALKKSARGFPVILNDDTLFYLYTRIGSFSPGERALAINQRINKLYQDYTFHPDSLQIVATENGYDILYKRDIAIMSVSQLDALWLNTTTDSLARSYHGRIISAVTKERKDNSLRNWLRRIGLTAFILTMLCLIIFILNKLFRRTAQFLKNKKNIYLKGLSIRQVRILTPEQQEQFALAVARIVRIVFIVLSVYIGLLLLSGIFAATEKWTDKLLDWIFTPAKAALHGIVNFLPNLFTILVIYFIFKYAIKAIKYFSVEIEKGNIRLSGFYREWGRPTFNIVKFLLYAFMLVLVFPFLPGSDSTAFKGVSVFLGILFSFGSSSAITNIVAGLVITYMRPFKIGDRVKIGDISGDVIEKTMLITRIRTIKNEEITVPNSAVLSSSTINYSANARPDQPGLILHTTVTIGYDTPWKKMHAALLDAAGRTEDLEKEPSPFVLQTSLDDFFVSYQLNAYTRQPNKQALIYSVLHQNIQDACNEAGIEIMSPHYHSVRDGNSTTIPPTIFPGIMKPHPSGSAARPILHAQGEKYKTREILRNNVDTR
jgi:small-conductance mechanosensitive channel